VIQRLLSCAVAAAVFGILAWGLFALPTPAPGLTAEAHQALDRSGVSNPVTAVLLNYRSYDTLLELCVLLLAVLSVWSLRSSTGATFERPTGPLLEDLLRVLVPLLIVTGAYLLWIGAFAPGGAFQGGALLGGAMVLVVLGGLAGRRLADRIPLLRVGLWIGLAAFIAVGLAMIVADRSVLEYPVAQAKWLILLIEAAALVSIGLTLGCLFYGGRPESDSAHGGES
jgi:multisubunit Na+/H+ antiporter MnhB subunit